MSLISVVILSVFGVLCEARSYLFLGPVQSGKSSLIQAITSNKVNFGELSAPVLYTHLDSNEKFVDTPGFFNGGLGQRLETLTDVLELIQRMGSVEEIVVVINIKLKEVDHASSLLLKQIYTFFKYQQNKAVMTVLHGRKNESLVCSGLKSWVLLVLQGTTNTFCVPLQDADEEQFEQDAKMIKAKLELLPTITAENLTTPWRIVQQANKDMEVCMKELERLPLERRSALEKFMEREKVLKAATLLSDYAAFSSNIKNIISYGKQVTAIIPGADEMFWNISDSSTITEFQSAVAENYINIKHSTEIAKMIAISKNVDQILFNCGFDKAQDIIFEFQLYDMGYSKPETQTNDPTPTNATFRNTFSVAIVVFVLLLAKP